jgi:hypothetical protein
MRTNEDQLVPYERAIHVKQEKFNIPLHQDNTLVFHLATATRINYQEGLERG